MTLPIRVAPIDQRWQCHGCGRCCRGTIISLGTEDRQRLAEQHWEEQPEFSGKRIVARHGLLRRQYHLAKNKDGTCIFLEPDGLCRIHKQYGLEAKPLVCQMFPFQLVPLENFAYVTLRRYCPSAAADDGQPWRSILTTFVAWRQRATWRPGLRLRPRSFAVRAARGTLRYAPPTCWND